MGCLASVEILPPSKSEFHVEAKWVAPGCEKMGRMTKRNARCDESVVFETAGDRGDHGRAEN